MNTNRNDVLLNDKISRNLGLTSQPFVVDTPDAYFEDQSLALQISAIRKRVLSGKNAVLIYGDAGVGKSTMMKKLHVDFARLGQRVCYIQASPMLARETILRKFMPFLDDEDLPEKNRLNFMLDALDGQADNGAHLVLLIDDVERLNANVIKFIQKMKQDFDRKLSLIVSTSQKEAEREEQVWAQRLLTEECYSVTISPMSQVQALAYLRYKFEKAGFTSSSLPVNRQFGRIHTAAGGNLNQLNKMVVEELSARGPRLEKYWNPIGLVTSVSFFAIMAMIIFYQPSPEDLYPPLTKVTESDVSIGSIASSEITESESNLNDALEASAVNNSPTFSNNPPVHLDFSTPSQVDTDIAEFAKFEAAHSNEILLDRLDSGSVTYLASNTEWLNSASDESYTIQLAGNTDEKNIQLFFERALKSDEKSSLYTTENNDAPWFVVVGGQYDSFSEAKSAIQNLPTWMQKGKPWPRKISLVKQDIIPAPN